MLNFLIPLFSNFQKEHTSEYWASELFSGLVRLVYFAYCIRQGMKELQNDTVPLPYPRILAIVIEAFNVIALVFILTQIDGTQIASIIPNIIIGTGMAYLLTQNLRITFNNG